MVAFLQFWTAKPDIAFFGARAHARIFVYFSCATRSYCKASSSFIANGSLGMQLSAKRRTLGFTHSDKSLVWQRKRTGPSTCLVGL